MDMHNKTLLTKSSGCNEYMHKDFPFQCLTMNFSIFYYKKANAFNTNEMLNISMHIHIQMQQTTFNNTELLTTTKNSRNC